MVDIRPDKQDLTFDMTVVIIEDGKIRNPGSWDAWAKYADLHISSHCFEGDEIFNCRYGADCLSYRDVYVVDRRRAELMASTLRGIERKLERLNDKFGRPNDFAQLLGYLAVAITNSSGSVFGIKTSGAGWSYDDNTYRWMDVNEMRYHLRDQIRTWKEGK
jgi:hypothetical protein